MTALAQIRPVEPVTMTKADGWIVVARTMQRGSVIPPYKYDYSYTHCDTLQEAFDLYRDYERGEHGNAMPQGIVPARHGVPCASALPLHQLPMERA